MPSSKSSRRKAPPLQPGFSQLHWMRLVSSTPDLTEGVGVADAEQVQSRTCRVWSMDEVRRHNTREDAWMALRGRVYNVTRYLRFHPGSVEELMRGAGDDATEAFDEVHPWVNAESMLAPCCVGILAPPAAAAPPATSGASLDSERWGAFELVAREDAGADSALLRFALPAGQRHGCVVGEHLQVKLGSAECSATRAFTPVSAPHAEGHFELLVRRCEPGALSRRLYALQPGSHVLARGPRGCAIYGRDGSVRLPTRARLDGGPGEVSARRVVCVSAGSGITPTLFLLRSLAVGAGAGSAAPDAAPLSVHVVHTSRSLSHVPGATLLRELIGALPDARLTLVCPEGGGDADAWRGREGPPDAEGAGEPGGRTAVVEGARLDADVLSRVCPPAGDDVLVLCCGPPGFNVAVAAWARDAGHGEGSVHVF